MKQIFKSVALMAMVAFMGFGLQSCDSTKPIEQGQLEGYWVLEEINGEKVSEIHKGAVPTMEFFFGEIKDATPEEGRNVYSKAFVEKGKISGSAGCNTYSGAFTVSEKNIFTAPALAMTMMACPEMDMENKFSAVLSDPNRVGTPYLQIAIDPTGQLIFKEGDKTVLVFKKGEKPAPCVNKKYDITVENLEGNWTLTKLGQEDLAELFGDNNVPTMILSKEGKATGKAGCNTYNSNFSVKDEVITFTLPMTTRMTCPFIKGEGKFTTALKGDLRAVLINNTLTLSGAKDGIIVLEFEKVVAK